jgi:glycerol-3-phosphate O-acyltransferase
VKLTGLGRTRGVEWALDRVQARRPAHRGGGTQEPPTALGSDTREVAQLLAEHGFDDGVRELAGRLGRDEGDVRAEAAGHLREMAATHDPRASQAWERFCRWLLRAYDVWVHDDELATLRGLDREHSLIILFSHRSYLDAAVLPVTMSSWGISPAFTFGGANLNFFPMGSLASRTGTIFIRRESRGAPVYRFALRAFIGQFLRNRANLMWSIEGGRTRTGKLRPPMYGILRYVVDAVEAVDGPEVLLVPVSIVYDQLHEVSMMTSELRGGRKRPENMRWLMRFARQQRQRLGRVYVDFGEPLPLRARLAELRADQAAAGHAVERVALDVCHRINRATPVTATAVVSLALLAADRALTVDEVLATVRPLADYIARMDWPVAGAVDLTDRSTIRRALQEMVASGVLSAYDGGTDTVWGVGAGQHLVAAFYRNTAVHILVGRAIGEIALLAGSEGTGDPRQGAVDEALRLRELLKFDFFFPGREAFVAEMATELELLEEGDGAGRTRTPADATRLLEHADLHLAHLVLRPFLDAYHVVADRLGGWDGAEFDEARFLDDCLRVGRQWELQRRLASAESVSLELFKSALRLARHRDLVHGSGPDVQERRQELAEQVRTAIRRVSVIAGMARTARGAR